MESISDHNFKCRIPVVRVNTSERKPFAEYGIQCKFRAPGLGDENVHTWKLWRRYSEFKDLDAFVPLAPPSRGIQPRPRPQPCASPQPCGIGRPTAHPGRRRPLGQRNGSSWTVSLPPRAHPAARRRPPPAESCAARWGGR